MYEDRYAGRNPFYAPPRALVDVALEPGETVDRQIVHRISPEDPWRRVRNRWRAEGVFAGPPPQPPTYLIGSSRRDGLSRHALPRSTATTCSSASPATISCTIGGCRRTVSASAPPACRRIRPRSSSPPPTSGSAPSRSPTAPTARSTSPISIARSSISPTAFPNRSSGSRISIAATIAAASTASFPTGFTQPPPARLGRCSTAELVATLEHPNAWHRETAARLLYERQDKAAIPAARAAGRALGFAAGPPARAVCAGRHGRARRAVRPACARRSRRRRAGAWRPAGRAGQCRRAASPTRSGGG